MNTARVYQNEEFWFVDFIDDNYELLPTVGIFKNEHDAKEAARKWTDEKVMETLGESYW